MSAGLRSALLVGMGGMLMGGWLTDRLTRALGLKWGRRLPMASTRFVAMGAYLACLFLDTPAAVTRRGIPRQSSATAIVFAVKWPAQAPGPGHATASSSSSSSRESSPRSSAPTASHTSWIVTSRPCSSPARIGPP